MLKPLACSSRLAEGVPSDRPDGRTPDEAGRSDLCSKNRHFCHSSGQKLKRPDRRLGVHGRFQIWHRPLEPPSHQRSRPPTIWGAATSGGSPRSWPFPDLASLGLAARYYSQNVRLVSLSDTPFCKYPKDVTTRGSRGAA